MARDSLSVYFMTTSMFRARVKNGRLVLDEPTDLPEGEVVELVPLDEALADGDDLDDEDRARLHESLRDGIRQARDGDTVDAAEALARLRQQR